MRQVIAIQTSDGQLHLNEVDATKHAYTRYNDAMTRLRHAMQNDTIGMSIRDIVTACGFIESNFDTIAAVAALHADFIVQRLPGEDE